MSNIYKAFKNLYRRQRKQLRDSYNKIFGTDQYQKFIIITYARTGSNLLMSYLDSHPHIEARGELFRNLEGKPTDEVWNRFFNKKNRKISTAGFKLFYTHPFHTDDRKVWDIIAQDKDIKIIHLVRKNKLRTFLSGEIAKKTDKWTRKRNSKIATEDKKIEVEFDHFCERVSKIDQYEKDTRENFKTHDFIEVCYEDLVFDKATTMNAIFDFLHVERSTFKSGYKKQNTESLPDLIINFDSFHKKLSESKYAYLLNFEK